MMLRLYFRHSATGITVDTEAVARRDKPNTVSVDMRDGTMALIDKVAVERGMSVVEAMSNSAVEIIAEWKVDNGA